MKEYYRIAIMNSSNRLIKCSLEMMKRKSEIFKLTTKLRSSSLRMDSLVMSTPRKILTVDILQVKSTLYKLFLTIR